MSVITKSEVILSHQEGHDTAAFLRSLSSTLWAQARRTKSAAVRAYCETEARKASDLEASIVRRLYSTTEVCANV